MFSVHAKSAGGGGGGGGGGVAKRALTVTKLLRGPASQEPPMEPLTPNTEKIPYF